MASLEERLDQLEAAIKKPTFRQNKGKANEVNYWVFDYPPEKELEVRERIAYLRTKNTKGNDGFELVVFDLYDIIMDHLESKNFVSKCKDFEGKKGISYVATTIQRTLKITDKDNLIVRHIIEHTPENAVVFLTGIGKCYPLLQSPEVFNKVLYNMPQEFAAVPMILFYPGTYTEQELPLDSVRELIANSIAHRSYLEPGNIQIALFDDRLEVTSPGMLLNGVSIAKMKEGYSKIRNRAIANAFSYMKIIEKWGSGIPRIIRECKEYGLPEPEFLDFDGDFRVNMFRKTTSAANGISDTKNDTNDTNETIALRLICENPSITQKEMKEKMGVSLVTVKRLMSDLQKRGRIQRKGSSRSGTWQVEDPKE